MDPIPHSTRTFYANLSDKTSMSPKVKRSWVLVAMTIIPAYILKHLIATISHQMPKCQGISSRHKRFRHDLQNRQHLLPTIAHVAYKYEVALLVWCSDTRNRAYTLWEHSAWKSSSDSQIHPLNYKLDSSAQSLHTPTYHINRDYLHYSIFLPLIKSAIILQYSENNLIIQ